MDKTGGFASFEDFNYDDKELHTADVHTELSMKEIYRKEWLENAHTDFINK